MTIAPLAQCVYLITCGVALLLLDLCEEAVKALNLLQTNASVLNEVREKRKKGYIERDENVQDTRKFLARSGISLEDLDALPVIHVAGTKGKGSTCALCESILRHYGMEKTKQCSSKKGAFELSPMPIRTGLYTSPHLIEVRERIQLNGRPISHNLFATYFWKVYNKLMEKREHEKDMPPYFKFLTVLAFNIFIKEGVDVAVIEVGIGGENDCTNVIRKPVVIGITTLGIDHQKILGDTLDKIAWQKAGIMKTGAPAFTALGQAPIALKALEERAKEKKVTLKVCPPLSSYSFGHSPLSLALSSQVQEGNASLALQLSNVWIKWHEKSSFSGSSSSGEHLCIASPFELDAGMINGLIECKWPGRTQILHWQDSGITFFLDGAHTAESIKACLEWFTKESLQISPIGHEACIGDGVKNEAQEVTRVLLFNSTGDRNIENLLGPFAESGLFKHVMFSPNTTKPSMDLTSDQTNMMVSQEAVSARCQEHRTIWQMYNKEAQVSLHACVANALGSIKDLTMPSDLDGGKRKKIHVLVSGSLHLVGSVLSIIDPDLSCSLSPQELHSQDVLNLSKMHCHGQSSKYVPSPA
ncbi:folylpolyglutamate synthase, mitochondrial-like isoform X2 [Ischnura elegans]|uniref:folylpolyglutamate synthase, mitochondrial-like isoform X2 n=1 Tax=Ischnura elegans TaxID=197161 RepID=UPI001ED87ECE|nr:folylpolyglutamate synthase, mitochondrial-like isoform X2 [Ischnura elegans]